jgi:V/A-type H+-transporting ATPase subunit D
MTTREITPTHSAYLELKAERAGMREGYRFLDEKRLILASEILSALAAFESALARWRAVHREALSALRAAVGRHGLEELSFYPPSLGLNCDPERKTRSVLGVRIERLAGGEARTRPDPGEADPAAAPAAPVNPSPEAAHCARRFAALPPLAQELAILTGNLERLRVEYIRTARRARALEDVLLPELDDNLQAIDSALEELEREEAVRVRRAAL